MAGRSLTSGSAVMIAFLALHGLTGGTARAAEPEALLRQMAAQPLRYGGILERPLDGRLLIGLDAPGSDGMLHGETMLLTADRHLIDIGTVSGRVQAPHVPGGQDCTLDLAFARHVATLHGICGARTLSGELTSRTSDPPSWLTRQIFWWDRGDSLGRAWLTTAAFYD